MTNYQDNHEAKGRRILLVDDDQAVRNSVYTLLDGEGYPTIAARNGLKAFAMFHRAPQPFDLLVTDCNMPGMSGAEVASACLYLNPGMGVLYMSGSHPDEELLAELRTGRRAFLLKPFRSNELLDRVRQLLAPRFEPDTADAPSQVQLGALRTGSPGIRSIQLLPMAGKQGSL